MIQQLPLKPIGDSPGGTGTYTIQKFPQRINSIPEPKKTQTAYEPEPVPQKQYLQPDPETGVSTPNPQDPADPSAMKAEADEEFQIAGFNGYLVMLIIAAILTVYNWR